MLCLFRLTDVLAMMHNLPKTMGWPWEGCLSPENRPIRILDLLGRSVSFPVELCYDLQVCGGIKALYIVHAPNTAV